LTVQSALVVALAAYDAVISSHYITLCDDVKLFHVVAPTRKNCNKHKHRKSGFVEVVSV